MFVVVVSVVVVVERSSSSGGGGSSTSSKTRYNPLLVDGSNAGGSVCGIGL